VRPGGSTGGDNPDGVIEAPDPPDRIYLARGDDVDAYRPVLSGDVFKGRIPTIDEDHEAMVVLSHPCSMRAGAHLRSRIQVAPVARFQTLSSDQWRQFYKVMPLPDLFMDGKGYAAPFDLSSPLDTSALDLAERVACLSEYGVLVMFQRHVRHLTRFELGIRSLEPVMRAVFTEVELQDEWNQALARKGLDEGAAVADVLAEQEEAFDDFMRQPGSTGASLRDDLKDPFLHATVRRAVSQEIQSRLA
jgi:hypothetical protein